MTIGASSSSHSTGLQVSCVDAAGEAIEHTRRHLFPIDPMRWLILGLAAFLDQCGRGGGSGSPNFNIPSGGGPSGGPVGGPSGGGPSSSWLTPEVLTIVAVVAGVALIVIAIYALVLWINSRAIFVYVDNVATGRAEIARPWTEHGRRADSLFLWRLALFGATLVGVLVLLGLAALLVWPMFQDNAALTTLAIVGLVGLGLIFFVFVLVMSLVSLALRDFAAPLQIHQDLRCGPALNLTWSLVRQHPFPFVGYVLLKIVYAVVLTFMLYFVCCFTCCLGVLPVINQIVLQPFYYFERSWSLYLLRQTGYDLLGEAEPVL